MAGAALGVSDGVPNELLDKKKECNSSHYEVYIAYMSATIVVRRSYQHTELVQLADSTHFSQFT